jgi:hypothetical protein
VLEIAIGPVPAGIDCDTPKGTLPCAFTKATLVLFSPSPALPQLQDAPRLCLISSIRTLLEHSYMK